MLPPPFLCPIVRWVDSLDAEMLSADGFSIRADEHRVGYEIGCEVECADEVGGVLGAGEAGDGDAAASGWNRGMCGGGPGEHEGRFKFIL